MLNEDLDYIKRNRVIAVIRMTSYTKIMDVIEALIKGGIKLLEITMTVPDGVEIIKEVAKKVNDDFLIGAGTVLDAETARSVILAGASFIVSPNTNYEVIKMCKRYSRVIIPGAFTPTEILKAWENGADIVKVFPASYFGPRYFKDIKGPYPQIELMPTGGVSISNALDFINAGACAVSIGGELLPKEAIERGDFHVIVNRAKELVSILNV